jgi:peptidoglycan/LPS O-acetylase OafA/YrhL
MFKQSLSPNKRSGTLDLLRFFAIIFIYFGHFADSFNYVYQIVPANLKYTHIVRYGSIALVIFFIVSAFVVTMTSMKRTAKEFVLIRVSRLYPLFWVSCVVGFIVSRYSPFPTYIAYNTLKDLLANLTMIPSLLGFHLINPVYHTLVIEIGFYIFILLILAFKLWDKILWIISVLIAASFIGILYSVWICSIVTPFIAGMLFYFIYAKKYTTWKVYTLAALNFVSALLCSKSLADDIDLYYKQPGSASPYIFALLIIVIYAIFLLVSFRKINIPGSLFLQKLGELSYSFFLFHIYFLGIYWYFRNSIQGDILLIGLAVVISIFSLLVNLLVEKPLNAIFGKILTFITELFTAKSYSKEVQKLNE